MKIDYQIVGPITKTFKKARTSRHFPYRPDARRQPVLAFGDKDPIEGHAPESDRRGLFDDPVDIGPLMKPPQFPLGRATYGRTSPTALSLTIRYFTNHQP